MWLLFEFYLSTDIDNITAFSAYGFQLKRMYNYHTYGSYVQYPFEPQRKVSVCLTQGAAMQQYRQ